VGISLCRCWQACWGSAIQSVAESWLACLAGVCRRTLLLCVWGKQSALCVYVVCVDTWSKACVCGCVSVCVCERLHRFRD
jgi:hypothetical protein